MILAIRESPAYLPELALVAEVVDQPEAGIVAHVMVSGTDLLADDGPPVRILMLSPLGVDPPWQNRGIGTALVQAALSVADERPEPLLIVQGHPTYYPRFGFVRGRTIGILPPEHLGPIDQAWMARRRPGSDPAIRGRVVYPQHFLDLD